VIAPSTLPGFESPSLSSAGRGGGPAFELKFLLDADLAARVEQWTRDRFAPDPHGDPALDGAYRTTTVYLDTPDLAVYHRQRWYRRRKLRLRRYGELPWAFAERKSKGGDRVIKRRSVVAESEISLLDQPASLETWPAHWFHRLMLARRLRPACRISYLRCAFVGECPESPLRATFDRDIRGVLATDDWQLTPCDQGLPLLQDRVIFELKFHNALPQPFKELVRGFALNREAWGLSAASGEVARA
jgi:hypothetical protein